MAGAMQDAVGRSKEGAKTREHLRGWVGVPRAWLGTLEWSSSHTTHFLHTHSTQSPHPPPSLLTPQPPILPPEAAMHMCSLHSHTKAPQQFQKPQRKGGREDWDSSSDTCSIQMGQ